MNGGKNKSAWWDDGCPVSQLDSPVSWSASEWLEVGQLLSPGTFKLQSSTSFTGWFLFVTSDLALPTCQTAYASMHGQCGFSKHVVGSVDADQFSTSEQEA
jgi:hypothetical protein